MHPRSHPRPDSPSDHHLSWEKSGATIGLGLPERQCPPRAASDHPDTPRAGYRNFGVADVEVGDFSSTTFV